MTIRNLDALFAPQAIALIGGSNREGSVGAVLARNLFGAGFKGPVMPVHPRGEAIRSAVSYREIADLPATPDLAVVATPAAGVPEIAAALGARGCRAAIVISAGFEEPALRQRLLDAARPSLLRLVGPNGLGVISPRSGVNASFAHLNPRAGDLAFVSQSDTIASSVLDWADVREIGFSHVVSVGDMIDVDIGDLLDALAADPKTRAILLYVETITNARKFMTAARIAARAKPVVVIKAGRWEDRANGQAAGSDEVYDAAIRRAGMLRVRSLRDLFAAVATLASGLRPRGDRLAILANGGGPGAIAADTLADTGGRLAALSPETRARLAALVPDGLTAEGPVALPFDAGPAAYAEALGALLADPGQDAVLVLQAPRAIGEGLETARAVAAVTLPGRKAPILASWLGERAAREARRLFAAKAIPTYATPDEAVRGFMQLVEYRRNQDLLMQTPPAIAPGNVDLAAARRAVDRVLAEGRRVMTEPEAKTLLAAYAVPVVRTEIAADPAAAAAVAARIGFPVALKILSGDIQHKTDVGGVRLDLDSAAAVEEAATHMRKLVQERRPGAAIEGFTVQPMVPARRAHELVVGVRTDPVFGPVISFGQGGTGAELIADRAVGLPPLNGLLAREMIGRTEVSRLLAGYSDRPPADLGAVAATLITLSQIVADFDEIAEIDINPLLADERGVVALDARIVLAPSSGRHRSRFAIQPYPGELEETVSTRSGTAFRLRPIRPEDEPGLVAMLERCDPEDVRLRFFAPVKTFGHAFAARLTQIDYSREMAFVGFGDGEGPQDILGVARLIADPDEETAEFGIMVRSDQKGRGLGYLLMNAILRHAARRGLKTVTGEVLAENRSMLAMAGALGFRQRIHEDDVALRRVEIDVAVMMG